MSFCSIDHLRHGLGAAMIHFTSHSGEMYIARSHRYNSYEIDNLIRNDVDFAIPAVLSSASFLFAAPGIWALVYTVPNAFSAYTIGGHVWWTILSIIVGAWAIGWGWPGYDLSVDAYREFRTLRSKTAGAAISVHNDVRWQALMDYAHQPLSRTRVESWQRIKKILRQDSSLTRLLDDTLATYLEETEQTAKLLRTGLDEDRELLKNDLDLAAKVTFKKLLHILDNHDAPMAHHAFARMVVEDDRQRADEEPKALLQAAERLVFAQNMQFAHERIHAYVSTATQS